MIRVSNPCTRRKCFSCFKLSNLIFRGYRGYFRLYSSRGLILTTQSIKNGWNYISVPPIRHRDVDKESCTLCTLPFELELKIADYLCTKMVILGNRPLKQSWLSECTFISYRPRKDATRLFLCSYRAY